MENQLVKLSLLLRDLIHTGGRLCFHLLYVHYPARTGLSYDLYAELRNQSGAMQKQLNHFQSPMTYSLIPSACNAAVQYHSLC
jgi:hypothetical protein